MITKTAFLDQIGPFSDPIEKPIGKPIGNSRIEIKISRLIRSIGTIGTIGISSRIEIKIFPGSEDPPYLE